MERFRIGTPHPIKAVEGALGPVAALDYIQHFFLIPVTEGKAALGIGPVQRSNPVDIGGRAQCKYMPLRSLQSDESPGKR